MQIHLFENSRLFSDAIADVLRARGHDVEPLRVVVDVECARVAAADGASTGATYVVAADGPDATLAVALTAGLAPADVVVLLDSRGDPVQALDAEQAGARAVLTKAAPLHVLVSVVEGADAPPLHRYPVRSRRPARAQLTGREREVLEALVEGASTPLLAAQLGVSAATARTHVQNVMMKLGAHSRLEAVAIGVDLGIVGVRHARVS